MGESFKHILYKFLSIYELDINMYMARYNVIAEGLLFITKF